MTAKVKAGIGADDTLIKVSRSSARWLYWFAVFSIINGLLQYLNVDFVFSFGVGVTELSYALGLRLGGTFLGAGTILCGLVFSALILFGYFAAKHRPWAFVAGLVLVSLDLALLALLAGVEKFLSIAVHVGAIIALWRGMRAARLLSERARVKALWCGVLPSL